MSFGFHLVSLWKWSLIELIPRHVVILIYCAGVTKGDAVLGVWTSAHLNQVRTQLHSFHPQGLSPELRVPGLRFLGNLIGVKYYEDTDVQ